MKQPPRQLAFLALAIACLLAGASSAKAGPCVFRCGWSQTRTF